MKLRLFTDEGDVVIEFEVSLWDLKLKIPIAKDGMIMFEVSLWDLKQRGDKDERSKTFV